MIPEIIKQKIEGNADDYVRRQGTCDRPDIIKHDFTKGAEFGYQLALTSSPAQEDGVNMYDSIDGDFVELEKPEDAVKYVRNNYVEGNEIHPDFGSFDIFKKIGQVVAIEENDIVTDIKYEPLLAPAQEREVYRSLLGLENPYPLKDVLRTLVNASEILLDKKNYDGHDHEEIFHCVKRAKESIEWLEKIPVTPIPASDEQEQYKQWEDILASCFMNDITKPHKRTQLITELKSKYLLTKKPQP